MADRVSGNISALQQVITEANTVKGEFSQAQEDFQEKIKNINSLAKPVDAKLTDVSDKIFGTSPIEKMIKGMEKELEQLQKFDEDEDSGGAVQFFRNLLGGFTQASVGILEGLGDGILNKAVDICNLTGAKWAKKFESKVTEFTVIDFTSKATSLVGGEHYDENSIVAKIGKTAGTLVTYHFIPGGSLVADAAVGYLSGYGQQMQKSLRAGKTIEESRSEAKINAGNEAAVAVASDLVFMAGGAGLKHLANTKVVQNIKNSGVVQDLKNSKVGEFASEAITNHRNKSYEKTASKLDDATQRLAKAEDGLKAAESKSAAADEGIGKKFTTWVGEKYSKHKVNSAQKKVALAEEETYIRARKAGKTDEVIDLAAKRGADLKTSADEATKTFNSEGTRKNQKTRNTLSEKVQNLDEDITRVSEASQLKKDAASAEEKIAKAKYDMDDAARQLPKEQAAADEAVVQARQNLDDANKTFETNLAKQDAAEKAKNTAQENYNKASDKVTQRNNEINEQNKAIGREKPSNRQKNELKSLNTAKTDASKELTKKRTALDTASAKATKSAGAVDDAEKVLASAEDAAKPENLPSYQKSVQARQDLDTATDDLTKLKAKQGDSDALRQQSMANNPELVAKKAEAEANLTQAKQHVDEVFDHGDVAIQKAEAKVTEAEKAVKKADDALEEAISKDVSKAQKEIQERTTKTLTSADNIMKETQPKINPISKATYNHFGVGQYKNIGVVKAAGVWLPNSQSADNVLKSQNPGNYIPSSEDNNNNNDNITDNGQSGNYNYDDTPTYPSDTGTGSGGGYGPTSSNPVNYDDSSDQFRSTGDTTTDNKTDDTNKTTDDASKTDTSTKPTTPSKDTTTITPATSSPSTSGPTTSITTPPSNGNGNEATTGSTNTIHTGGGYTGTSGYTSGTVNTTGNITEGTTDAGLGTDSSITGALTEGTTSIEDVIKGSKVTKIPTSPSPVTTTSSSSGSSAVIPIAAGLSAAAAAGIGAKAYMDRKHNNDNGEDDEDEFDTDEWSGDDSVDIQYDEDTANGENYLDDDDDYSYQATSNNEEKYDARSSEELADLQ